MEYNYKVVAKLKDDLPEEKKEGCRGQDRGFTEKAQNNKDR